MRANPYTEGGVRLQKVLAQAGVASRRASEQMIADGRVSVDGTVVRNQGVRVDPATQVIHVDGERLILDETKHIVLAVNKPIGTVSTMSDPEGRPTIADLIADYPERLYHVGRLDIGPAAADQRRRAGQPPHPPQVRDPQDLRGAPARRGQARRQAQADERHRAGGRSY